MVQHVFPPTAPFQAQIGYHFISCVRFTIVPHAQPSYVQNQAHKTSPQNHILMGKLITLFFYYWYPRCFEVGIFRFLDTSSSRLYHLPTWSGWKFAYSFYFSLFLVTYLEVPNLLDNLEPLILVLVLISPKGSGFFLFTCWFHIFSSSTSSSFFILNMTLYPMVTCSATGSVVYVLYCCTYSFGIFML